ncbi:unnamed protein product [Acanthoscelides obtectus]|uniref:Uncharacterized protein n=1 Tax=Acanthoscelides obtectus TaxID=200917 RepID=A0A9P0Q8B3_ACAOB|nr:unnamed protein product [Acanthoscelides obtectus]CAK1682769.1 hypothetical protein AOBTE_LOCUS33867 [Acanthoscelides obtectus]
MIKILLTTLCIAYLAIACEAKCKVPSVGVELDNNTASGVWYGHDIYGPPTIGDGSCFVTEWSVNNDSKIEVHDSWKDHGGKEVNVDSTEVDSETEEGVTSYTFNIGDDNVKFWFLLADEHSMAAYSCDNKTENANVFIMSREQNRHHAHLQHIEYKVRKLVHLPHHKHIVHQTHC